MSDYDWDSYARNNKPLVGFHQDRQPAPAYHNRAPGLDYPSRNRAVEQGVHNTELHTDASRAAGQYGAEGTEQVPEEQIYDAGGATFDPAAPAATGAPTGSVTLTSNLPYERSQEEILADMQATEAKAHLGQVLQQSGIEDQGTYENLVSRLQEFDAHTQLEVIREGMREAQDSLEQLNKTLQAQMKRGVTASRFYANGGGAGAALAVAAGALAQSLGGPGSVNTAYQIISDYIDRDIREQEMNLQNEHMALQGQMTVLQQATMLLKDREAALQSSKAALIEDLQMRLAQNLARVKNAQDLDSQAELNRKLEADKHQAHRKSMGLLVDTRVQAAYSKQAMRQQEILMRQQGMQNYQASQLLNMHTAAQQAAVMQAASGGFPQAAPMEAPPLADVPAEGVPAEPVQPEAPAETLDAAAVAGTPKPKAGKRRAAKAPTPVLQLGETNITAGAEDAPASPYQSIPGVPDYNPQAQQTAQRSPTQKEAGPTLMKNPLDPKAPPMDVSQHVRDVVVRTADGRNVRTKAVRISGHHAFSFEAAPGSDGTLALTGPAKATLEAMNAGKMPDDVSYALNTVSGLKAVEADMDKVIEKIESLIEGDNWRTNLGFLGVHSESFQKTFKDLIGPLLAEAGSEYRQNVDPGGRLSDKDMELAIMRKMLSRFEASILSVADVREAIRLSLKARMDTRKRAEAMFSNHGVILNNAGWRVIPPERLQAMGGRRQK